MNKKEPYTIYERLPIGGEEEINLAAVVASAGVNINSVTPVEITDNGDGYNFVSFMVCYEFQWKSRGNYIWNKTCDIYNLSSVSKNFNSDLDDPEDGKSFWADENVSMTIKPIDCFPMFMDIVRNVIIARDQLEDPDDRGRYFYNTIPDNLPEHIKVELRS